MHPWNSPNVVISFWFLAVSLVDEGDRTNKQNVVITDAKSGINMAITVAVTTNPSAAALFTTAAQKPPVVPGGSYITISRKKLLQNLEINGTAARINAWVDSMKASSPTHVKSTPSLSSQDETSWMVSLLPFLSLHTTVNGTPHVYENT